MKLDSKKASETYMPKSSASSIRDVTRPFTRPEIRPILAEPDFLNMVDLERRRTERTGRPIVIMLVHLEASADLGSNLRHIVNALKVSKRQTDLLGWYAYHTTLGVIFNEINRDQNDVARLLRERVVKTFENRVGDDFQDLVSFSFHIFPEPDNKSGEVDLTFYPAVMRKERYGEAAVKRCTDLIMGTLGLVLFLPLFLTIAVAIKLTSRGPVLYEQERIGQYGRRFTLLKFRSMYVNSSRTIHEQYVTNFISGQIASKEQRYSPVFKIVDDPRVTRLGRFLRKWSMDEMPQFLNVLKGDMSLVGPRPPLPYEVDKYSSWHKRRIIEAKPGITGLWQINGRSKLKFDDMVRLDLAYVEHRSLWLDLMILLKTPSAVISGDGAY